jgi:hypothetical protein
LDISQDADVAAFDEKISEVKELCKDLRADESGTMPGNMPGNMSGNMPGNMPDETNVEDEGPKIEEID